MVPATSASTTAGARAGGTLSSVRTVPTALRPSDPGPARIAAALPGLPVRTVPRVRGTAGAAESRRTRRHAAPATTVSRDHGANPQRPAYEDLGRATTSAAVLSRLATGSAGAAAVPAAGRHGPISSDEYLERLAGGHVQRRRDERTGGPARHSSTGRSPPRSGRDDDRLHVCRDRPGLRRPGIAELGVVVRNLCPCVWRERQH